MARLPYEELGTLADDPELTARVIRRPGEEKLYLLNRVPHGADTRELFRDLYFYSTRKPERAEFEKLFSEGQTFCVLFCHHQGPSLREQFPKPHGSVAWRMTVLADALFHVYGATKDMPLPVVCSMLQPDNILFDENEQISLRWKLEPRFWKDGAGCSLWASVAELMRFLVGREAEAPRFRALNSVYKKCQAGLYPSLPAMIHDLRRARESLNEADPVVRLKAFFYEKKARLLQASQLGIVVLLACLIIYVIVEVQNSRQAVAGAPITDIGNITYVSAQEEQPGFQVADPVRPPQGGGRPIFSALPRPDAEISSEDYVVQSGDTLESICAAVYGAEGYGVPVAFFNGLEDGALEAGMVLRLPLRDQLAQYLERWQEDE